MATLTYKEQLQHPNWQRRRLEALEAAGFSCEKCGDTETMLHVHHKRYVKGRKAWEYELSQLEVQCAPCHESTHANRDLLERLLHDSNAYGALEIAIGLLGGYLDAGCSLEQDVVEAVKKVDGHFYDLGMLAAIAGGADWDKMAAAARIVAPSTLSPSEQGAIDRWDGKA